MSAQDETAVVALEKVRPGSVEGGIPVGSAIIKDGKVIGKGRNMRIQNESPILHPRTEFCQETEWQGETAPFDSARELDMKEFKGDTLHINPSACPMCATVMCAEVLCAGAMILFVIKKVVIGENEHMSGREELLKDHGVEVIVLNDQACKEVWIEFIEKYPSKWKF